MIVKTARVMGFCGGVRRAVSMAETALLSHGDLQTDGPVVHNPDVMAALSQRGVVVSPSLRDGLPVLIRAHGAPPNRLRECQDRGLRIIDATCPHVASNQRLAAKAAGRGDTVIFAGDPDHAETRAVTGSAGAGCVVVSSVAEVAALDVVGPVLLLAQTTFGREAFFAIKQAVLERWPNARVEDSICGETVERQNAARELAAGVEAVVVVGGKESANTRRLVDAVGETGVAAFLVENVDDLDLEALAGYKIVGVTAGASTPDWVIADVVDALNRL